MKNNIDYHRLLELKELIDNEQASSEEKKEYIELLYQHGSITKKQYKAYLRNENTEEITKAALTIGGVLLATWLITKLLER